MFPSKARKLFHFLLLAFLLPTFLISPATFANAADPSPTKLTPPPQISQPTAVSGILQIPFSQTAPQIDGLCDDYTDAVMETFTDGNGNPATVYLKHTSNYLFVCMKAQPGTFDQRFGSLYLDPQGNGSNYVFAQADDYALHVGIPGTDQSSFHGTGVANGYVADTTVDAFWSGAATANPESESVEYQVSTGRFRMGQNCSIFGLAMYHHWFSAVGDDYGWPSNRYFDQPKTWQLAQLGGVPCGNPDIGKIAYVFRGSTVDAISYYNLLTGAGYSVDLIPLGNVLTTDFTQYRLIVIADDTGDLDQWGFPAVTANQVNKITSANMPIIGLGEGGYAFFGQLSLFVGWPNGWHGPQQSIQQGSSPPTPTFFNTLGDPVQHYATPKNSVGIYLNVGPLPTDVSPIGLEDPTNDHASLILQGCDLLWGNSGNPLAMTPDGKVLFLNGVDYMIHFQCSPPTPPPDNCILIEKSSSPPSGATVQPGDVISYTITYTYSNNPDCQNPKTARLVDSVPVDTTFVPNSATDGISPGADGALVWAIFPAAGPQTKQFKVVVSENQCADQRRVNNRAGILVPGRPPVISNVVTHPVECPPIGLPNDDPLFAEGEIEIHPYPLIAGMPNEISVRVTNNTSTPQTVNVSFQTSPNKFGIGLDFNSFDNKTVTLPANGSAIVKGTFVPVTSGHYCIQIVITGPALAEPLKTQRNLDVTEDLHAGVPDLLPFMVRNNTTMTATVQLVVDNTCPGWDAQIIDPAGGAFVDMGPGEIMTATLSVTPPNPVVLGSGCHIDVQGWIGDQLIGGIRKLDVPPVQLPTGVNPPWEEPEISFEPDPPVVGQPGKICVELQNPLAITRTVTVEYAVADFGAGIGFTTVATQTVTLPPYSNDKYCADWTPSTSGTLHRCALVTLKQPGYQDMRSQRNVNLVRVRPSTLGDLRVPFVIGNPDLVDHTLTFSTTVVGLIPAWQPKIVVDPGDPPPDMLKAGEMINLSMILIGLQKQAEATTASTYQYGDVSKIEVTALLDGKPAGGFSVELTTSTLYMPIIR